MGRASFLLFLEESLKTIGIKNYQIIFIPDIHNPPKWVDHVLSIFSDFDLVISNNSLTKELFKEKGYRVIGTKLYEKNKCSGKVIRKKIIERKPWKYSVPPEIYNFILKIDGEQRLRNISKQKT